MRKLSAEEQALWNRVVETVRPFRPVAIPAPAPVPTAAPKPAIPARSAPKTPPPSRQPGPGTTLDGSWDKRLARGAAAPDASLDLHGHNLDTAWTALDRALERAIGRGDRLLLLVTGKPPAEAKGKRGAIRAAIDDWLHVSRHAGDIAAVRGAHPRHGGSGASTSSSGNANDPPGTGEGTMRSMVEGVQCRAPAPSTTPLRVACPPPRPGEDLRKRALDHPGVNPLESANVRHRRRLVELVHRRIGQAEIDHRAKRDQETAIGGAAMR